MTIKTILTDEHNVLHTRPEGWRPNAQELLHTFPQPSAPSCVIAKAAFSIDGCTDSDNCRRCQTIPEHRGDMRHAGLGSYPPQPAARGALTRDKEDSGAQNANYEKQTSIPAQEPSDDIPFQLVVEVAQDKLESEQYEEFMDAIFDSWGKSAELAQVTSDGE